MQETRLPLALLFASLSAFVLGIWLALTGLTLRFFGAIPSDTGFFGILASTSFGPNFYSSISIETQAWLRIVVGTGFAGGVAGLWLRQAWAFRGTLTLCALAATFFGLSSIAVPLILVCLAVPSTRSRIQPALEANARQVSA
jgi:hypothetical protein